MNKWHRDVDTQHEIQHAIQAEKAARQRNGTSDTDFLSMKSMTAGLVNPYLQHSESEEQLVRDSPSFSEFPMSRSGSSTSLRTRSNTNGSVSSSRPNRIPLPEGGLTVHTHQLSSGSISPLDRSGGSYFSPLTESSSTRSSAHSPAAHGFSRKGSSPGNWNDDFNRGHTSGFARGMPKDALNGNSFFHHPPPNGRLPQRPSLPPLSMQQGPAPNGMVAQRMRSASSPDIHNHGRYAGAHMMQTVDNVPVPPIPAHMANMIAPVNRSQTNSPNGLPIRSTAASPSPQHVFEQRQMPYGAFREPHYSDNKGMMGHPGYDYPTSPLSHDEPRDGIQMPSQLKARIIFDNHYVTLVIASNILYRTLTDRVDAKLSRFTDARVGSKTARLRYQDEDGDFVTIDSDEAVQLAIMEWREQHRDMLAKGIIGEIHLWCQSVN